MERQTRGVEAEEDESHKWKGCIATKEDVYWVVLCMLSFMIGNVAWLSLTFEHLGFSPFFVLGYISAANTVFAYRNIHIDDADNSKHRIGGAAKCVLDIFIVETAVMIRHFFGCKLSAALVLVGMTVSSIGMWRLVFFSRDIKLWDVPIQASMQFAVCITGDSGLEALKAVLILCGVITFYRYWFYDYYFVDLKDDEIDGEVINTGGGEDREDDKVSRLNRVFLFFLFLYLPWYGVSYSRCLQYRHRNQTATS